MSYRIAADYDYLYPIFLEGDPTFIDIPIVMYSNGGISSDLKNCFQCQREYKKTVVKYGERPSIIIALAEIKVRALLFCNAHNLILLSDIITKISFK